MLQRIHHFENHHKHGAGITYIILSQFFIIIAQSIIKKSTVSVMMFVYHRAVIILMYVQISTNNCICPKNKNDFYYLILQGLCLGFSAPFFFISIRLISLSEGIVISQLNTIWSQFLALIFLKEALSKKRIRNILLCIFGLILITRPYNAINQEDSDNSYHLIGCLLGLFASFTLSLSYTFVKLISQNVNSSVKVFYMHLGILLVATFCQEFETIDFELTYEYIYLLIIATIFTYLCHAIFQYALTFDSYASLAPYSYINVIISLITDILIFQKIPQILSLIGGAIISISMILNVKNI